MLLTVCVYLHVCCLNLFGCLFGLNVLLFERGVGDGLFWYVSLLFAFGCLIAYEWFVWCVWGVCILLI